jgi:signal transduction histidine kinase
MQSHPVTISVSVSGTPCRLEGRLDHNLLRIGQEAIANAVKHAHCQKISVELQFEPAQFKLLIVDDGCGLTSHPSRSEDSGHYGLMGMRERARKMGGEFSIRRCADGGTQIMVTIPIPRAKRSLPEALDLNPP